MNTDLIITKLTALAGGLENCIENARERNDLYDVGYMEAMLESLHQVIAAAAEAKP